MHRKGILLAGGSGSRLLPLTKALSKQLLPVYDKPMIYYPLSVLMLANIREILIISTPNDLPIIRNLLGDGERFGISLMYEVQERPQGLAQALLIGEQFIAGDPSALVLGDNLIFGQDLTHLLLAASADIKGATIFGYRVADPSAFGVVEFDSSHNAISIEEKPLRPKSPYAIPGLYFFDSDACALAKKIQPSSRGELEITDLNRMYLERGDLRVRILGRGCAWLDMGTHEALHKAAVYVESIQSLQGYQIANLEEIAFRNGWISTEVFESAISEMRATRYGQYLRELLVEISPRSSN